MNKCTRYEHIKFNNGILDNIIDAVYVITLENSSRLKDVYKQINEYKLSKNNYIQFNKKFTECEVNICKKKTSYHLIDNNIKICIHANKNNYKNILIFEDDFILDNRIKDKNIIKDLTNFINNNTFNIYYLGILPFLFKLDNINKANKYKHLKLIFNFFTHSYIMSKKGRDILINKYKNDKCLKKCNILFNNNCYFHDLWLNFNINNRYFYYKPLCYQKIQITKNTKNFDIILKTFYKIIGNTFNNKISVYFDIHYYVLYLIYILCIIILYIIIFFILKFITYCLLNKFN